MAKNHGALFVGPIVNDVAEDVGVGTGGDALKEAAFDDRTTLGQTDSLQILPSAPDHMSKVEQYALHPGIAREHCREQRTIPSTNIGQDGDAGKIVSVQHACGFKEIQRTHPGIEDRTQLRMGLNVIEDGAAKTSLKPGSPVWIE